jgi:hypothetical protein
MIKSVLNKMLDFEADQTVTSVVDEVSQSIAEKKTNGSSPKQPLALTLDQRSNLYLNAVYGSRDFTNEEYAEARETLLDAMAADFAAHPKSDVSDLDDFNVPVDTETDHLSSEIQALMGEVRNASHMYRPMDRGPRALEPSFSIGDAPELDHRASIGAAPEEQLSRTRPRPYRATAMTVCWTLASVAIFYLVLSGSPQQHTTIADLSLEQFNKVRSQGSMHESTILRANANGSDPVMAKRLLDLGDKLIAGGDLYGGRIVLAEAVDEGSGPAALHLGSSFDPSENDSSGKDSSDPAKAKFWYLRAKQLGERGAQVKLDRLKSFVAR